MTRTRRAAPPAALLLCALAGSCQDDNPQARNRQTCSYGPGALASTTLADTGLTGAKIPIDHFVLVMQENRTFDHYFSSLTVPGQTVDGASPDAGNPDPRPGHAGETLARFHQGALCFDNPAESWEQVHREVDDGGMDGFTAENAASDPTADPAGLRSLGYYDESDLPYYYALARAFAISDRHFASTLGNTYPNRLFYMAGTAFGVVSDVLPPYTDSTGEPYPNLFTLLDAAGVDWRFYAEGAPTLLLLLPTYIRDQDKVSPASRFYTDAQSGNLPAISFVEGADTAGGASSDEDPPADPQLGQALVARIVAAVTGSPQWPSSALLFSYDEQGGFYDHVPPPRACVPDAIPPQDPQGGWQFDTLGLRVPLIAVSPYAKRGYVSHQITDHTSILRLLEARFSLPALTRRDANAEPPFDLFDFSHAELGVQLLPAATPDPDKASACQLAYPPSGATRR